MTTITCKEKTFTNIEAIIFDKDGTLADSQSFLKNLALQRASLIAKQIPGLYEQLLMAFGVTTESINPAGLMAVGSNRENQIAAAGYVTAMGKSWFDSLTITAQCFAEAEESMPNRGFTSELFVGSLDVLKTIAQAKIKIGILSADTTQGVKDFAHYHQLSDYINLMMGVDGNLSKPNPLLYLNACEALNVKPEHTLMVGDSLGDISMAKNAGAGGVIGIHWHNPQATHLSSADVVISDLVEIKVN